MRKETEVFITKFAQKQYRRLPVQIQTAFQTWVTLIGDAGVETMRKIPGYHDEPLKGQRYGQRSSRLSRAYRVMYEEDDDRHIVVITVLEINKHEY